MFEIALSNGMDAIVDDGDIDSVDNAAIARAEAEMEYFGEFGPNTRRWIKSHLGGG